MSHPPQSTHAAQRPVSVPSTRPTSPPVAVPMSRAPNAHLAARIRGHISRRFLDALGSPLARSDRPCGCATAPTFMPLVSPRKRAECPVISYVFHTELGVACVRAFSRHCAQVLVRRRVVCGAPRSALFSLRQRHAIAVSSVCLRHAIAASSARGGTRLYDGAL